MSGYREELNEQKAAKKQEVESLHERQCKRFRKAYLFYLKDDARYKEMRENSENWGDMVAARLYEVESEFIDENS